MKLKTTCERCGGPASASLTQHDRNGRLVWALGTHCDLHDGHASEADGVGLPPPDLRAQLVLGEGMFGLVLGRDADTLLALRTLQIALDLTVSTVARIRGRIPGVVLTGTRQEITWLAAKLSTQHVVAATAPALPDPAIPDLADVVAPDWSGKPGD